MFRSCASSWRRSVPSCWKNEPRGWHMSPRSDVPVSEELPVQRLFSFLRPGAQYHWLGMGLNFGKDLGCIPKVEWFYTDVTMTLPPTEEAELLATFLNDRQVALTPARVSGDVVKEEAEWSPELLTHLDTRAKHNFCWALGAGEAGVASLGLSKTFFENTFPQWHHRADYLVSRKSRERREFRKDFSLEKVRVEGRTRKRRLQRRQKCTEEEKVKDASGHDGFYNDMLPREMRERLEGVQEEAPTVTVNSFMNRRY